MTIRILATNKKGKAIAYEIVNPKIVVPKK